MSVLRVKSRSSVRDPLTVLPSIELYLDAKRSLSALANGAAIGDTGTTWPDLSTHSPVRDAVQSTGSLRPLLRKSGGNASPNGSPLVQFDGVDDSINSSEPSTGPALTAGYSFLFHGRFRLATSPPAPFNLQILWVDGATGVRPAIGYERNPSGPPFFQTPSQTASLDAAAITAFYGTLAFVFSAPSGGSGICTAYSVTGTAQPVAYSSPATYTAWNPTTAVGYLISGNLSGNGCLDCDLGGVIWCSTALTTLQINATHAYWYKNYGV